VAERKALNVCLAHNRHEADGGTICFFGISPPPLWYRGASTFENALFRNFGFRLPSAFPLGLRYFHRLEAVRPLQAIFEAFPTDFHRVFPCTSTKRPRKYEKLHVKSYYFPELDARTGPETGDNG